MDIKNEIFEKTGRFYIEQNKSTVAEIDFQFPDKNTLLITHTEVYDSVSGKGIGQQLVSNAVDYARQNSLNIKATCSFAKQILDITPEYADVYHTEK